MLSVLLVLDALLDDGLDVVCTSGLLDGFSVAGDVLPGDVSLPGDSLGIDDIQYKSPVEIGCVSWASWSFF